MRKNTNDIKTTFFGLLGGWLKKNFEGFLVGFLFGIVGTVGAIIYFALQ